MELISHGGAEGVTGSCHQLKIDEQNSLLIDCGLFQGGELAAHQDQWQIEFDITTIKAVILTHVHLDHVGRLPALLAAGYRGPIYCSQASALLLPVVIEDALKVGVTRETDLIKGVLHRLQQQLRPLKYGVWQQVSAGAKIKLKPAGHILGSAYIEISTQSETENKRIIFSGDLGAPYTPLLPAPKAPYGCDWLILESTYGDRLHEGRAHRIKKLQAVIEKSLKDGGAILIPAFSIGRTQELLYEIEELLFWFKKSQLKKNQIKNGGNFKNASLNELPIIVDSPLAAEFTDLYRQLKPMWDREAKKKLKQGRNPLKFHNLITIDSHQQHQSLVNRLAQTKEPAIVIAASGMCSGGRIVNYLKALIDEPKTDIIFVGYQGRGTPGRDIQQYGSEQGNSSGYVVLDEQRYDIYACVHTISGYSAHADQNDLLNFVKRMRKKPEKITLVHGDKSAKRALAEQLKRVAVPEAHIAYMHGGKD